MKYIYSTAALFAATVSADLCAHGSTDDNGNYYCQEVKAITYTGAGGSGSYNKITNMDSSSGSCSSTPYGYSGSLAPLDEEVDFHFRGPIKIKAFAAYAPSSSSSKKSKAKRSTHERRHGHGHAHAHLHKHRDAAPLEGKRAVGDMVYATIDGVLQSWANQYGGGSPATTASTVAAAATAPATYSSAPVSSSGTKQSDDDEDDDTPTSGTGWTRQGYYNAEAGISDGISFLNHEGGGGSGVFDYSFGNSLSYASTDGTAAASSPQVLEDCQLDSSVEVVITTDQECSGDSCGYVRPGSVAHHGFAGASKAFMFEFEMPTTGETSPSIYVPVDMPAIWLLNSQIARTLQYGNAECSCWTTGCGEFDIFEVLAPGDTRCKSTLHGNIAGGDSDYFARPVNGTMKAALLLYKNNIHIKVLDDDTEFGKTMGDTFFNEMVADTAADSLEGLVSLFKLSS